MITEAERLTALREQFFANLQTAIPGVRINGSRDERLPNNLHFCIEGVEGEPMLLALDAVGVCASAGSACTAGSTEPSHVLLAIGVPRETARGALRLTLGRATTAAVLDYTLERLVEIVRDLRGLSGGFFKPLPAL
jgi:cysteine desulfurase